MYYVFSLTHSPPPSLPPSISISQMMVPDLKKNKQKVTQNYSWPENVIFSSMKLGFVV